MVTQSNKKIIAVLLVLGMLWATFSYAEEDLELRPFLPTEAEYANWLFSGLVNTEAGDTYGYFFYLQKKEQAFQVATALFDSKNKKIVLSEENKATLPFSKNYDWNIGPTFLSFNDINESFVFGIKTKDKLGFNFKVDMLDQLDSAPVNWNLKPGIDLLIGQTNRLNGHISIQDYPEQFVTAKNAWFSQIWLTSQQNNPHELNGIFCRFNDGSGFYSIKMAESDVTHGTLAAFYDADGKTKRISQFLEARENKSGQWSISSKSPSLHLVLSETLKREHLIAGFVQSGKNKGFCVINKGNIG